MEQVMNFVSLAWPFLVLVGIMYFFMYRPQQKLKVERGRFLMSLRKGDHVVTAGGIHGTIKVLRDKYVELEIAPKVIIKGKIKMAATNWNFIHSRRGKLTVFPCNFR